jgi:hypothetical protein
LLVSKDPFEGRKEIGHKNIVVQLLHHPAQHIQGRGGASDAKHLEYTMKPTVGTLIGPRVMRKLGIVAKQLNF